MTMTESKTIPAADRAPIEWACGLIRPEVTKVVSVRSGDESAVYEISTANRRWFLKLASNLGQEKDCLRWLSGRIPVPTVVDFLPSFERDALLTTGIDGTDLAQLSASWPADKVVSRLAQALRRFHAIDITNFEFGSPPPGAVLVHGDACLPNIMFLPDGTLSGFVDLGNLHAGDVEDDLSAALWSLQRNLGFGYGPGFLTEYGIIDADDALAERLRSKYESALAEQPLE
jgi:aminoglycoside phosphotransferase